MIDSRMIIGGKMMMMMMMMIDSRMIIDMDGWRDTWTQHTC